MAETPTPAPALDPNRPYRPPVIGSSDVPIHQITGYQQRSRSSYGQEIINLVSRFLEFITSRQAGTQAYNFTEVMRYAAMENTQPFEAVVTSGNLPQNLTNVRQALDLLLNGCPDFVFPNPLENDPNHTAPAIFFSPTRGKFLQGLRTFDTSFGFGLEGYFMLRRASNRYYAVPFKLHICWVPDAAVQMLHNSLACKGDWVKFIDGMLDYWNLKVKWSENSYSDSELFMKYEGEEIFLTRSGHLSNFIPSLPSNSMCGIGAEQFVSILRQFRYCTSEAILHAMNKVDRENHVRQAMMTQQLGPVIRNADYNYAGQSVDVKKKGFEDWLMALLRDRSVAPNPADGYGNKWGISYIASREKLKQSVGLVEARISAAIGEEAYKTLLENSNVVEILGGYVKRVESKGFDFFHISEGRLELDFLEYAAEKGLPVKAEEAPAEAQP